jgi:hypothetical protein
VHDLPEVVHRAASFGRGLGQLDRFLDPETEPVLAREEHFHNIKCTGRLAVHTPLLGRHQYRDTTHDRVGERLLIVALHIQIRGVERRTHPKDDVAAPECAESRAARAADRERDDRGARTRSDIANARTCADELPRFAAMSLNKEAERLACGEHGERNLQCAPIRFTPPDWKCANATQQKANDGCFEERLLTHVADRATQRELDPGWVLPVDVIGHEDVAAAPRDVLGALETPRREERRESANRRKPEAPDPEALLGKDRRSGDDGQERVTCSTRSRASPTERPSVSTRIASLAALRGATVRLLSSSSRRRISARRS